MTQIVTFLSILFVICAVCWLSLTQRVVFQNWVTTDDRDDVVNLFTANQTETTRITDLGFRMAKESLPMPSRSPGEATLPPVSSYNRRGRISLFSLKMRSVFDVIRMSVESEGYS